jgi:hypothetical protein
MWQMNTTLGIGLYFTMRAIGHGKVPFLIIEDGALTCEFDVVNR